MSKIILVIGFLAVISAPAMAQEAADADYQQRLEVAQKLSEVHPLAPQVEAALAQAAERMPVDQRESFKNNMMKALDLKKLEEVSIKAQADIFTLAELQGMLTYYQTPEARSAFDKMSRYQAVIQPAMASMLDAAFLTLRTGAKPAP